MVSSQFDFLDHVVNSHSKNLKPNSRGVFKCRFCDLRFLYALGLNEHVLEHDEEKSFQCQFCSRDFHSISGKFIHEKSHPPTCKICFRTFKCKSKMIKHLRNVHSKEEKPFECEICNRKFQWVEAFQRHKLVHSDERPEKCQFCPQTFRSKSSKIWHEKLHTGERTLNWKCRLCPKAFTSPGKLKFHANNGHGKISLAKKMSFEGHYIFS